MTLDAVGGDGGTKTCSWDMQVVVRRPALTAAAVVLLAASATGCAVGGEVAKGSPEPRADLAARAEVAAENWVSPTRHRAPVRQVPRGRLGSGGKHAGTADVAAPAMSNNASATTPSAGRPAAQARPGWHDLLAFADPVSDHGNGPEYADLTRVTFLEQAGMLATSIDVGAVVPGRLADREVQHVGIDFYRSSSDESDYQIFLDGGSGGWRAYLRTPGGFVDFPGRFSLHGRTFDVVVPWSSLGGRRDAQVGVFVDWSSGVERLSSDGTTRHDLPLG